jgi:hypothetical protein
MHDAVSTESLALPARERFRARRRSHYVRMAAMSVSAETTATAYVSAGPVRPLICGDAFTRVPLSSVSDGAEKSEGTGRTSLLCT